MSTPIFVQDVTLRDGMHAVRHRITPEDVKRIVVALDDAGVDAIEVAHGDGLAGGSVNYGPGSHTDWEWIEAAASVLKNARLTTLLLPGVGTIHELKRAWDLGVRSVRVATHCTEADVSAQHIATAREIGMDVSGFLMMSHMAAPADLAQQAKLMESFGAHCVYVTDSGGRLTMDGARERFRAYRDVLRSGAPGVQFVHLDGPADLIAARMSARPDHFMPPALLASQVATLEPLEPDEDGVVLSLRDDPDSLVRQAVAWLADR